jgi:serine/threonine protein kinase
LFKSPKSPKTELGRTRSQSRRTLGNWQLGKTIGQGSMGRVRLGHNLSTGEQVRPRGFVPKLTRCAGCCQDHSSSPSRECNRPLAKIRSRATKGREQRNSVHP